MLTLLTVMSMIAYSTDTEGNDTASSPTSDTNQAHACQILYLRLWALYICRSPVVTHRTENFFRVGRVLEFLQIVIILLCLEKLLRHDHNWCLLLVLHLLLHRHQLHRCLHLATSHGLSVLGSCRLTHTIRCILVFLVHFVFIVIWM